MVMYFFEVVTVYSLNFPVVFVECCEPVPNTCMEMVEMPHIQCSEIICNLVISQFFCLGMFECPELPLIRLTIDPISSGSRNSLLLKMLSLYHTPGSI
jgi:hypothetical protein